MNSVMVIIITVEALCGGDGDGDDAELTCICTLQFLGGGGVKTRKIAVIVKP